MSNQNVVMIIIVLKLFGGSHAKRAMINDSFFDMTTLDMKYNHLGREHYEKTEVILVSKDIDEDIFGMLKQQEDVNCSCDANLNFAVEIDPWIALVKPNGCDIEQQLSVIFNEGAKGAIIYSGLDKMAGNIISNRTIVFLTDYEGKKLSRLLEDGTNIFVSIARPSAVHKLKQLYRLALILGAIFCSILLFYYLLHYIAMMYHIIVDIYSNWNNRYPEDTLEGHFRAIILHAMSSMPVKTIKTGDEELQEGKDKCVICLEKYKISDVLRILSCKHTFHKKCIDRWLLEWQNCPLCKLDILTTDEEPELDFVVA